MWGIGGVGDPNIGGSAVVLESGHIAMRITVEKNSGIENWSLAFIWLELR